MTKGKKSPFGQINPLMYLMQLPAANEKNLELGKFICSTEVIIDLNLKTLPKKTKPEKEKV